MLEGATGSPDQDSERRSGTDRAPNAAPASPASQMRARNIAQSDAVLRTDAARQGGGSEDRPARGRIVGLADLAPAPAPVEDPSIEALVAELRALIASGQASIRFPGPGHRLDGRPAEPAAPNPAFASPEVHAKLVALLHKLTNEHRAPTEPWPLADFASKDIPELVGLANTMLEARNAALAPPPAPTTATPSFPGEGHVLGGSLGLEESRARLSGSGQPAAPRPAAKTTLPLLPAVAKAPPGRPASQAPQASGGGGPGRTATSGGEHGMRDRPSGSSTVTIVVDPPGGPSATPLLPGPAAPAKVPDGKQEVSSDPSAPQLPKAPPPGPSAAARRAAREAYRRHIEQGGGWASEAELAELAAAAGVTVIIHHFGEDGVETHAVPIGDGAQVVHLRHMGNHYDVIENGRIVRIAGDGHCGFVAFYRAVTGMLPTPEEVAELRRHAASNLPDEHVDNILAAQDAQDVDMHRMDGARDSLSLDSASAEQLLAILRAMLDDAELEDEQEPSQDQASPVGSGGPATAPVQAQTEEDGEALVVKQGIEDGASTHLQVHDGEIEQEVERALASGEPMLDDHEKDEEEDDDASEVEDIHHGPPGPPGPPDGGPGRGGRGGPGRGSASPPAPQVDYKPTGQGMTDAVLSAVDKGSALSGYVGTDGSNNFGAGDAPFKGVVDGMESAKGHTITSGVSDAVSAMGGTVGIGIQIAKLKETIAVLKSKEKNKLEKGKAVADIAGIVTGVTQQYCVLEGGVLTAIDGPNPAQSSNFGFTASGGNMMSTDFKMAGDAAGLLGDLIGLVGTALEAINDHEKLLEGTAAEAVGRVSLTVAKAIGTLGRTAKTLGQFIGQIQGHGQLAKDFGGAAFHTFGKQVVPLVGAGIAAMNIGRQSYNIHKYRKRRERLKQLIQSQRLGGKRQEAVQFIREVLKKRITRAGIDIGLSSVDLVSSVLQAATPIGSATGTAIAVTTTSVRLGMVATRVIKQKVRDRTAEKRQQAKDPTETYASWSTRQQAKGVKGKLNAAFTPNWDKSSDKKREAYIRHAMTIVEMDSDAVYDTIGLSKEKLAKMKDAKERVEAIIKALQKR